MRIIQLPEAQGVQASDVFVININGADYQVPASVLAAAMQAIGSYLTQADVANSLTITVPGWVLDARQGKALKDDMVTLSPQTLIPAQQAQVQANLGLEIATMAEVKAYLGLN